MDKYSLEVVNLLALVVRENFCEVKSEELFRALSTPPKFENGQLAFGCFLLSKSLEKSPAVLAQELQAKIDPSKLNFFERVESLGPYLNFYFDFSKLSEDLCLSINDQSFFNFKLIANTPKTMIEYSQPNTHKELHVGHMRNLCLGNSLAKIFTYCQVETLTATYPGDVGTHVAKTLWYLNKYQPSVPSIKKGAWLGKMYSAAHLELEEQLGTDKEQQNRKELSSILKQIKEGQGEFYDLWLETRQWSIDQMKEVYNWAKVDFDHWFFESEVDAPSLKLVDEYYEKGLFVKDQGAIGLDLSEQKLGFLLLKKTDGNGLYATKDLELARRKFEDFAIERNIYIVDVRQSLHFKQVFQALEQMNFPHAKDCFHLAYDFVELPDGAMSSRKGNIIALEQLIERMEETIITKYLDRYKDIWSDDEIKKTASIIANGAIKYGMCRYDAGRKIVFEMEDWLRLDGNSGPYLQYSYARTRPILTKFKTDYQDLDFTLISSLEEYKLIFKLTKFNEVVTLSAEKYSPHHLCNYLYELCQEFNRFYANVSINNSSEQEKKVRVYLIDCFSLVLKKGLELLGIEVPARM